MIIFLDIETNKNGKIIIIGVMNIDGEYQYFSNAIEFYNWLKQQKNIKRIYAYNLEFDFMKIWQELYNADIKIKFSAWTNTNGVVVIQMGRIYMYDLLLHFDGGLANFGKIIGKEKLKIDYDKIEKINNELIEYNKRDLELTRELYMRLEKIYKNEYVSVKASISSNALEIFNKRFFGGKYEKISEEDLGIFRLAYKGGWCEVFIPGEHKGHFYYVDVNSLYPYVMLSEYPKCIYERITPRQYKYDEMIEKIKNKYWLGFNLEDGLAYNNIEHIYTPGMHQSLTFIYIFPEICYPFRQFINYFNNKKELSSDLFERKIYKRLMNSLYGRFAMKSYITKILFGIDNINEIYKIKNIIEYSQYGQKDIYQIKVKAKYQYYVNIIWSLYTTAKARRYMRDMYDIFTNFGVRIFYIDTDCFIVDTIEPIQEFIDEKKIGYFKIQKEADIINILGKKMYRFGDEYVVKGIENEKAKEFFEKGAVLVKRMIKWRTALNKNQLIGNFYVKEIQNKTNIINYEWTEEDNPFL